MPWLDDCLRLVYYVVHDYIIVVDYLIQGTARDIFQRGFVRVTIVRMSLCLTRSMLMRHIRIRPLVTEGGGQVAMFGFVNLGDHRKTLRLNRSSIMV